MNFDFQKMKPVIQRDFDEILDVGPADMSEIIKEIPFGGDPYERKLAIIEAAAEKCPVQLFAHYPFAFKIDCGEERHVCYIGVGNRCYDHSGVDMKPLGEFRSLIGQLNLGAFNDYTDFLHRTLDHDKLLATGFRGVYEECQEYNRTENDPQKKRYREVIMRICLAVERIGLRLRAYAGEMLATASDEDVRYNLTRIVNSVNTPFEAPVTMFDALNTILCTTLFISALDGVEMNAYGSVDRLIMPFYERDLKEGRITRDEAYFLIQCFLHKTDMHAHFNDERKTYDNGVSVMIGGCDLEGKPVYNAVTDMIIDAYLENKLINPKLNARASAESPMPYLRRLAELMQSGNNNIIVENDDYIIPMFVRMGLSFEDARTYVGNGCQEVICRNQLHSRAFSYVNLPQILMDTLRLASSGEASAEDYAKIYRYGRFQAGTFAELWESFLANLRSYIQVLAEEFAVYERQARQINPETMLSMFTADCMKRGQDITEGGARYYHKTLSLVGFGTLCDSLLSLKSAYEKGSVEELLQAVEQNFAGYEALRYSILRSDLRFGHSEEADAFARQLSVALANVSKGIYNADGIEWRTSLFTYYMFQGYGARMGATPDGRLAGEPLSRQMNMASLPELTSAARSMAVLTEAEYQDVGIFDIALPFTNGNEYQDVLADYIRTCLELKIPVLQTNVADIKMLEEEKQQKGTHPDLVVRVCGYSAIFGQLDRAMQTEIIERLKVR